MVFDSREKAKKYKPGEGDTLEKIAQRERDAGNDITWEDIAKFNWGTADKAIVNEYLRDELGARLRDADNNFVISADDQPSGELLVPTRYKNTTLTTNKRIVLHVGKQPAPPKQFLECAAIPGVTFEFDKSFVRPSVVDHLATLKDAISNNPKAKFVIFGHTDKVGDNLYNKKLSERRAKSVYAFIVNDVEIWEQLYKAEDWGIKAIQEILRDLGGAYDPGAIDGKTGPNTEAAIKQYQKDRGLPVDGFAGPNTRKKLFADYMSGKHDIKLTPEDFLEPKHMGCGEFNPVVGTEEANEANRRVVFYLFHEKRPPRFPCRSGEIGACKQQMEQFEPRHRKSLACSFYDSLSHRCPCESLPQLANKAVFSQRLDWEEMPVAWLPILTSFQTVVQKDNHPLTILTGDEEQRETETVISNIADDVRYQVELSGGWSLEESIDLPTDEPQITPVTKDALNEHCFLEPHWRVIAQGFETETWFNDGQAKSTGGILKPEPIHLFTGNYYYRFASSTSSREVQFGGGWWLDFENYKKIESFAQQNGYSIRDAARLMLALPYVYSKQDPMKASRVDLKIKALLVKPMKAYAGEGKPAEGDKKSADKGTTWIPSQHIKILQLYIPGLYVKGTLPNEQLYENVFSEVVSESLT